MNPKAFYIEWEDASSSGRWEDTKDSLNHKTDLVKTVGWLLQEDKRQILVAQSIDGREQNCDRIAIPTSCVKKKRRLNTP